MPLRLWIMLALVVSCREAPEVSREAAPPPAPEARAPITIDAASDVAADAPAPPEGMIFVPAGTFTMGADRGGEDDEHPAHQVTLAGFWARR